MKNKRAKKVLSQFLKKADDNDDINGSTGACTEIALENLKRNPLDINKTRGLRFKNLIKATLLSKKAISKRQLFDNARNQQQNDKVDLAPIAPPVGKGPVPEPKGKYMVPSPGVRDSLNKLINKPDVSRVLDIGLNDTGYGRYNPKIPNVPSNQPRWNDYHAVSPHPKSNDHEFDNPKYSIKPFNSNFDDFPSSGQKDFYDSDNRHPDLELHKPSKELSPYGWISPKGEFYHVPHYAGHHKVEQAFRDNGLNNEADNLNSHYIHVSPENMKAPEKYNYDTKNNDYNVTEQQVNKMHDYNDAVQKGAFDNHPLGTYGAQRMEPSHKSNIQEFTNKITNAAANDANKEHVMANKNLINNIFKIAKETENIGYTKMNNQKSKSASLLTNFLKTAEKDSDSDPCWEGYEMIDKKKKDGKEVPNCVPKKKAEALLIKALSKTPELKAEALLKQALNPGAVGTGGYNIQGPKPQLPSGRVENTPAPTKAPNPEFNNYLKELSTPKSSPAGAPDSPNAPKHQGPGFAEQIGQGVKDKARMVIDKAKGIGSNVSNYLGMNGPGKHEAPKEPGTNHIQNFVNHLKTLMPLQNAPSSENVPSSENAKPEPVSPSIPKNNNTKNKNLPHPGSESFYNSLPSEKNSNRMNESPTDTMSTQTTPIPTPGADSAHASTNLATENRKQRDMQDLQNSQANTQSPQNKPYDNLGQYHRDNYGKADSALESQQELERKMKENPNYLDELTASRKSEIKDMVKTALEVNQNYSTVKITLNKMGYSDKDILRTFNN